MAIRNKILIGILIIMFLIAVFYPILAPYDENDFCFSPVLSPSKPIGWGRMKWAGIYIPWCCRDLGLQYLLRLYRRFCPQF